MSMRRYLRTAALFQAGCMWCASNPTTFPGALGLIAGKKALPRRWIVTGENGSFARSFARHIRPYGDDIVVQLRADLADEQRNGTPDLLDLFAELDRRQAGRRATF